MVALSPNLISVQPCVCPENKKREKAEFIIFREIKVPGKIPVIQYICLRTRMYYADSMNDEMIMKLIFPS